MYEAHELIIRMARELAEARARLERRRGPFTASDPMYQDPIKLIEDLEDKLHECQDSRSSDIAMIQQLESELAQARAALRDWYNYLHDDDDWDDMVSPASHQWRERHAAALKAAREAK